MAVAQILRNWLQGLAGATALAVPIYAVLPPAADSLFQQTIVWYLWPGLYLWFALGGSLFGGGFGSTGDLLVIAGGAALAWSVPLYVLISVAGRRRRA